MSRLLSSFPTENETNDFNRLDGLLKVLYETEYLLRSGVERELERITNIWNQYD